MSRPVLEVGTAITCGGREWTVAGVEATTTSGARIWLAGKDGEEGGDGLAVFGLAELFADPSFTLAGTPPLRVPQMGLLSTVPEDEQWRAFAVERHVREVETGHPTPDGECPVRPQYDPDSTTLAQREQAKATLAQQTPGAPAGSPQTTSAAGAAVAPANPAPAAPATPAPAQPATPDVRVKPPTP